MKTIILQGSITLVVGIVTLIVISKIKSKNKTIFILSTAILLISILLNTLSLAYHIISYDPYAMSTPYWLGVIRVISSSIAIPLYMSIMIYIIVKTDRNRKNNLKE